MSTIAFTYDPATPVGQTRLYAGDTDPDGLSRTGGCSDMSISSSAKRANRT